MSDIAPVGHSNPASLGTNPPTTDRAATPSAARSGRSGDRVELSSAAQFLSKIADLDVRQDLVDRVRTEIELGTYETPEKLEQAVNSLISDL